jgi:hypothetical protein
VHRGLGVPSLNVAPAKERVNQVVFNDSLHMLDLDLADIMQVLN